MSVSPEILKQVKSIELRTRGLVGSPFAGEYRSVFRGQGMEFAEVRAYEHGDDFDSSPGESLCQDIHRGAGAHGHADRGSVRLHALRGTDNEGGTFGGDRGRAGSC